MRAAKPFDDAFLEHAQQLRLELQRQLADLVEKDRAAVGHLESARLRRVRAGKRPALVPEELALDERRRERAAVDHDEAPVAPRAVAMNGTGDQLLAGAGLAKQEHRRRGRSDLLDLVHDRLESGARAHDCRVRPGLIDAGNVGALVRKSDC